MPRKRSAAPKYRYGVFLFGSEQADGARYDAGTWIGSIGEQRVNDPILIEETATYDEAKRKARKLNIVDS